MSAVTRGAIRGVPAAPGIAVGPYIVYTPMALAITSHAADTTGELSKLRRAADAVADERRAAADALRFDGHESEGRIFDAHAEIARDPGLIDDAIERIRSSGLSASAAIAAAAAATADMLRGLSDATLAGRASDVLDVGDRIAREAAGLPAAGIDLPAPSVIVAADLPPSITAGLPRDRVLAIVLAGSSPTAHAAILARAYGIPAVVGAAGILEALADAPTDAQIAVDGERGDVVLVPDRDALADFSARQLSSAERRTRSMAEVALPSVTRDGVAVELLANIGTPGEAAAARELGASGVGLFRTEFLFLERRTAPSEDEQASAYGDAAAAMAPYAVTVRLLDVGGDKPIGYIPLPKEENPFLGVRALRLVSSQRELFVTQLRACYRAARRGRVKVMAPMIADADDAALFIELAHEASASLAPSARGELELGVMLEIPSAVLSANSYFPSLSFGSLGTNDLLQYTLAADRGNAQLERYRDGLHPAHLALVRMAVDAARRHGLSLSVCGEMAGDPVAALVLIGLGLRSLSMTASSIAAVKHSVRGASLSWLATEAGHALHDPSAAAVRRRFASVR